MANNKFEDATAAFLAWLDQVGIQMSPKSSVVDLRQEGRGRGVVATADFESDEIIFSIPRSAVLNVKNVSPVELGTSSITTAFLGDLPSWLSLTIIMMSQTVQQNPRWLPYLAILPPNLDSLVFWPADELEELQASAVIKKIGKGTAEHIFHQRVAPLCVNGGSMELFHLMASTIMAYAFDIPQEDPQSGSESSFGEELVPDDADQSTVLTMIPLADILNADADRNNARLICDNEDLEMRSIKKIKKGEEIFNDYGLLPRSDLLRRYGYITDGYIPYDVAELSTASIVFAFQNRLFDGDHGSILPLGALELEVRLDLARRENIYEESYDVAHASPEEPCLPDELVSLIYILLVDDNRLACFLNSEIILPTRSEIATKMVGTVLRKVLSFREKEYTTSMEEDHALLESGNHSYRKEMAIRVRHGEKNVLREAMSEAASFGGSNRHMRVHNTKRRPLEAEQAQGKRSKFR